MLSLLGAWWYLGFRVQGLGFRGLGFWVLGLAVWVMVQILKSHTSSPEPDPHWDTTLKVQREVCVYIYIYTHTHRYYAFFWGLVEQKLEVSPTMTEKLSTMPPMFSIQAFSLIQLPCTSCRREQRARACRRQA